MKKEIKKYYGEIVTSKEELKTSVCCSTENIPHYIKEIRSKIHNDVLARDYGCGSPIPFDLEGKTVLDLGCGSGVDAFTLSALVGEKGRVIGVDMTEDQILCAKNYTDYHMKLYGYKEPNVEFILGDVENLKDLGINNNSIDVVISNCVLNLVSDKKRIFRDILNILKLGGELYFSDIFTSQRLPEDIKNDPLLYSECIGGAIYKEDFRRLLYDLGIQDFRIVREVINPVDNVEVQQKLENTNILSTTLRIFNLDLEDRCENYGQVAIYKGGIKYSNSQFALDDHHIFKKNLPVLVCGNTADMISKTRFSKYFEIFGDKTNHYGLFPCKPRVDSDIVQNCC